MTTNYTIEQSEQAQRALGRADRNIDVHVPLSFMAASGRILVTGASGALGQPLVATMRAAGVNVLPSDIDLEGDVPWGSMYMDVRELGSVHDVCRIYEPSLIIHLAASKLAPVGELEPWDTAETNILGTHNMVTVSKAYGIPIVMASTCKAIEPETAYGASKAIGEKLVLNSPFGTVARYFNVPEAGPSVLTIWNELDAGEPLPVTPCTRYFISFKESIALTLWTAILPRGRYIVDPGPNRTMDEYASDLWPGRETVAIPPRRGDRIAEPLHGKAEWIEETQVKHIMRVFNPCDPPELFNG